jgi:AGZA family xanthine/uracil permease-like MFS transporter
MTETGGGNQAAYLQYTPDGCDNAGDLACGQLTPAQTRWLYFTDVVKVPSISKTAAQFDFSGFSNGNLWLALITFLYVDFLDATGTLYAMAGFLAQYIPNFIRKDKTIERQVPTFCVDGFSIVVGSLMGLSPITIFVESASGIREGARTGLASWMIGFWFFVALWFSPLLASIPGYATGPALILVGAMMTINIVKIRWNLVSEAVPAFLTIVIMPLTYSIAYGFIAGIMSYLVVHTSLFAWNYLETALTKKHDISDGRWKVVRQMTFNAPDPEIERGPGDDSFHFGPKDDADAGSASSGEKPDSGGNGVSNVEKA